MLRITKGSPAWKPHARLAEPISGRISSSAPMLQAPKLSPRSALRLTFLLISSLIHARYRAADQIGAVQGFMIDFSGGAGESRAPALEGRLALLQRRAGFPAGDALEPHRIAGPQMAEARQIGADHGGDLGITAGGLPIRQQNDRLAVARHLDDARHDAVGGDFRALVVMGQGFAGQAQSHAVAGRSDLEGLALQRVEAFRLEMVVLRAGNHADRAVLPVPFLAPMQRAG